MPHNLRHKPRRGIVTLPSNYWSWRDAAILKKRNGVPMLVHEGFRSNVLFISDQDWEAVPPLAGDGLLGTAFFVSVDLVPYAVTAKHVIVDCPEDQPLYLITNKRGGGYKSITTMLSDWVPHPDTDVAICEVLDDSEIRATAIPSGWLVPAHPSHHAHGIPFTGGAPFEFIGLGDEVFTVGLYDGFCGSKSIQPIARFGRISLMPNAEEKIRVVMSEADEQKDPRDLPEIEAYLIEANGWEGQSGASIRRCGNIKTAYPCW